jgi:DNA polymerase alpha subunit A
VPYVICCRLDEGGAPLPRGSASLADRAFHPEEVHADPALRVDFEWYLANQVGGTLGRYARWSRMPAG